MTVHDWTRVDAGTFHDFHLRWIAHLVEGLNGGLLPRDYYAQAEQHAGPQIADVLTLSRPEPVPVGTPILGGEPLTRAGNADVAVLDAPPLAALELVAARPPVKGKRRTLTVRHVSGHRIVALVEIVSPANKDRRRSVQEFVTKAAAAVSAGVHVVVADLFPPGRSDPAGLVGAVWAAFDRAAYRPPPDRPLAVASVVARDPVKAYVTPFAVGEPLPTPPLFLTPDRYLNLPLGPTYAAAFRGTPAVWREVLEGTTPR